MNRKELRKAGQDIRLKLGLGNKSTSELAPGFNVLVDEMMFGKIWARPGLSLEEKMLSTLSALTSRQILSQLRPYISAALHIGLSHRTIQEVMIHCGIYSGLPSMENSLKIVSEIIKEKQIKVDPVCFPEPDLPELFDLGESVKQVLHGDRAEMGYAALDSEAASKLYPTAIEYGYGAIWGRPYLDRRQRMICTISAFTAIDSHIQCRKFFRSATSVGLDKDEIHEVIIQTAPYSGFPRALNALSIADEVIG